MNAVWLSDELLVSPGAVAGLVLRCEWAEDAQQIAYQFFDVEVVLLSGARLSTRRSGDGWMEEKEQAEAEVARLSELLWPTPWSLEPNVQCGYTENGLRCIKDDGHPFLHEFG